MNAFLYLVGRSPQPPRAAAVRTRPDGTSERRPPLPMLQLSYLVSAWAGSTRDEHQLLGDVMSRLIATQVLPAEHLGVTLGSSVQLSLASDELNRPRDLWSALGGSLKASFTLVVTVASDAYDWENQGPEVRTIEALAAPIPTAAPAPARGSAGPSVGAPVTRRGDDGVLRTTVPDGGS